MRTPTSRAVSPPQTPGRPRRKQYRWTPRGAFILALAVILVSLLAATPHEVVSTDRKQSVWQPEISPMGKIARGDEPRPVVPEWRGGPAPDLAPGAVTTLQSDDRLVHSPFAPDFQSETTIAANGNWVVVGYNDIRGFGLPNVSVSGVAYSHDGGVTWTDNAQLPTSGAGDQVFGDPDVKSWTDGANVFFVYSSLYTNPLGNSSLCVHVSTDGGVTWLGPREVTTATSPTDFPDKEFIDVDPETGRIIVSWTNFGASTTMRVTYSDDLGLTWNGPWVFPAASAGQGSVPRCDPTSLMAYVVWRSGGNIVFSRSIDNGITWGAPVNTVTGLGSPMNPYGSDRIHGFPSMDVDAISGAIYVVYSARQLAPDFSDVYFMSSNTMGATWSAPVTINARPGGDRAQFFPWVAADEVRKDAVTAVWYDQILGSGSSDITDMMHTHSFDGGLTWVCPTPLTDDRFHAEYGNTTSQPNVGDYNQCVMIDGVTYTSFAKTNRPHYLTFAPDTYVDIHDLTKPAAPLKYVGKNFTDTGCESNNGYWEPGETIRLFTTIGNYSNCVGSITGITGTLTTVTPGVTIVAPTRAFGNLGGAGTTNANIAPFDIQLDGALLCGSEISFTLQMTSSAGDAYIPFKHRIGRPVVTPLLSETFDGVAAPALPPGWTTTNLSGALNAWVTSGALSSSGPNSAFCADVAVTSLNELRSPLLPIPPGTELVRVQFAETHDIEVDFERRAWDGALLRMEVDGAVKLAGSFSETFEPFYQWQMNRQSSASQPLQDLSCWSDNTTPNFQDVVIEYPSLGGTNVRLRFDMSTDGFVGTASGIFIDDVEVSVIDYVCDCTDPPALLASPSPLVFPSVAVNTMECDTIYVSNTGPTDLVITGISGCDMPPFSLDLSLVDSTLSQGQSTKMIVCVMPTAAGPDTCEVTITSNDPSGPHTVAVRLDVVTDVASNDAPRPFEIIAIAPNPFNPETAIRFNLPEAMTATIEVWSVDGRRVSTLARDRRFGAGVSEVRWQGRNDRGEAVASGVYFVRIRTALGEQVGRAVLLK
ncbi:MAG: choice-of-anchor D domain-containing protein [Candidatus Krumholzibacteria bacterium]|nr:choice-of-anchor D domain-containing protein [Candidatus Krumholzibacteria bacterium]